MCNIIFCNFSNWIIIICVLSCLKSRVEIPIQTLIYIIELKFCSFSINSQLNCGQLEQVKLSAHGHIFIKSWMFFASLTLTTHIYYYKLRIIINILCIDIFQAVNIHKILAKWFFFAKFTWVLFEGRKGCGNFKLQQQFTLSSSIFLPNNFAWS